jgi:Mn-dependent DtxR family transcriptional regulator
MTQDRVDGDDFHLTHEFLAMMLGVRRATVTVAAAILHRAGLIKYSRGRVRIIDRPGLEEASCECYHVVRRNFVKLVGATTG